MRLVTLLAEEYNPGGRLDEIVAAELVPEGWTIARTSGSDADVISGADVLLVMMRPVLASAIEGSQSLRLIQAASRGYDAIDVNAAARKGIPVCNVLAPGHASTVAEHTFALLLALAKRINEGHADVASGGWGGGELVSAGLMEVSGKLLGIVGLGEIGKQVALRADAFGMRLVYSDVRAAPELEARYRMPRVALDDLLATADVVSLHVPLDDGTTALIGERELSLMKRGAILLNTSRGPIIDLDALAAALLDDRLRAGLDVFDPEPPPVGHPILSAPNLVCSPHVAGVTTEAVDRVVAAAIANIRRLASGQPLEHVVNGAP